MVDYMVFSAVFNSIAAASAPIRAFLVFFETVLRTIFFPSHWLLSHVTIGETTVNGERGMNPNTMTITNAPKKILTEPGIEQATSCS